MRIWNGLNKNDIVLYRSKQWRIIDLIEKENNKLCKIESIDTNKIEIVEINECQKIK